MAFRFGCAAAIALVVSGCAGDKDFSGAPTLIDSTIGPAIDDVDEPASVDIALGTGVRATVGAYRDPDTGERLDVVPISALAGWEEDDHAAALQAFLVSCDRLDALPDGFRLGGLQATPADWRATCEAARRATSVVAREFFETWFTLVRVAPEDGGLVTSYYEPVLEASRQRTDRFRHPIYRRPDAVARRGSAYGRINAAGALEPYYSRAQIDAGALDGQDLEIAYLEDPVDLFFLHIQGSGRLEMTDGTSTRVGFAAKNGHQYRSVGAAMRAKGWDRNGDASANAIRALYREDPSRGRALLGENPAYIFFEELTALDPNSGPRGAFGVQLVDGRSIAVDRRYAPYGGPVWLETTGPLGPIRRLTVAHDTGTAIVGPQRADYFWGVGDEAGRLAGQMKSPGSMTLLLPNPLVRRLVEPAS